MDELVTKILSFGGAIESSDVWAYILMGLLLVIFIVGLILKTRVVAYALIIATIICYYLMYFIGMFLSEGSASMTIILMIVGAVLSIFYGFLSIFILKFPKKSKGDDQDNK